MLIAAALLITGFIQSATHKIDRLIHYLDYKIVAVCFQLFGNRQRIIPVCLNRIDPAFTLLLGICYRVDATYNNNHIDVVIGVKLKSFMHGWNAGSITIAVIKLIHTGLGFNAVCIHVFACPLDS